MAGASFKRRVSKRVLRKWNVEWELPFEGWEIGFYALQLRFTNNKTIENGIEI